MRPALAALALLAAVLLGHAAQAKHHHHHDDAAETGAPGLADVTLLIVRHAEKPAAENDTGLAPAGAARAKAYASYFRHFAIDGAPVKIDALVASADSDESARPRLTLAPLAQATGLPLQQPFANKKVKDLARWLAAGPRRGNVLIAWHHGTLAKLLGKLGADPDALLPGGVWPDDVYDWVIVLRYDADGQLAAAKRVVEPADLT